MEYIIKEYNDYNEKEVIKLYESVGWLNYTKNPIMLKNSFMNSLKVLAAYNEDGLIGLIRVVGDGFSIVYIQDVLVNPLVQRRGIGTALIKRIMDEYKNVYQMNLLTDNTERTIKFYKSLGFYMDTDIECRAFSKMLV